MLTEDELARRLRAAMDWREPRIPSVLVARRCGVTPQAVNKWRKDGQIDLRKHLSNLATVTQVPPMFYLEPEAGKSRETKAAWMRLSEWVTKAAVVLLMAIPPLLPSPAQAAFNIITASLHIVSSWLSAALRRLLLRHTGLKFRMT